MNLKVKDAEKRNYITSDMTTEKIPWLLLLLTTVHTEIWVSTVTHFNLIKLDA